MSIIGEFLSYPFIIRAIVVGILISVSAALLGVILVLKRYSLIGHGLADVGFGATSFALLLSLNPLLISTPIVIIASFFIMMYGQKKGLSGDAAIGMVSTTFLALGIVFTFLNKGANKDALDYMFGSIMATTSMDVVLSIVLAVVVILSFIIFYNRLFLVTYDEEFAKTSGINVSFYQLLISFLTALTVVIGMRMIGTLLISSLIIFPSMTAQSLCKGFRNLVILSAAISGFCFIAGMFLSLQFSLPSGAAIVLCNLGLYAVIKVIGNIIRK